MAIYLNVHKVNLLLLCYLQMITCPAALPAPGEFTSTCVFQPKTGRLIQFHLMPLKEICLAQDMIFQGESSAPIIPEEVQTISEKETIQEYKTTFPHLNTQQFRIKKQKTGKETNRLTI
jgi:hypothetical protein